MWGRRTGALEGGVWGRRTGALEGGGAVGRLRQLFLMYNAFYFEVHTSQVWSVQAYVG